MKRKNSVRNFCKQVREIYFPSESFIEMRFFFSLFLYETIFCPLGSLSNYSLKLLKIGMFFDIKELLEDFSN